MHCTAREVCGPRHRRVGGGRTYICTLTLRDRLPTPLAGPPQGMGGMMMYFHFSRHVMHLLFEPASISTAGGDN